MPFVRCYRGVKDGALFPLEEGLLFFRPPLFVPRDTLRSISCGRGNGGGSKYVDLVATLEREKGGEDDDGRDDDDDTLPTVEFTNIDRMELMGLNKYINKVLIPAMAKDSADDGNGDGNDDDYDDAIDGSDDVVAVVE